MHSFSPMHGRTRSSAPARVLATMSGSAIVALAMATRSACPAASTARPARRRAPARRRRRGGPWPICTRAAERRPLVVVVPAVRDVARIAPVVADVEAEVVDRAVGRERGHRRRQSSTPKPPSIISSRHSRRPERDRAGRVRPDRLDDLAQEPAPLLEGAAVLVVAPVGQRREEPLHEVVVVGVDLDGVDAARRQRRRPTRRTPAPASAPRRRRARGGCGGRRSSTAWSTGAIGIPPCRTICTEATAGVHPGRELADARPRSADRGRSPGPLAPTPVGSNPGGSGLRTKVGPPPSQRMPPASLASQYAQCCSNVVRPQQARRRRSGATRPGDGRGCSVPTGIGENECG